MARFTEEQAYIIKSFKTHFAAYKKNVILLYGVGKNTKFILDNCAEYNIVGLMDEAFEGEVVYGKPVFSKKSALETGVEIIVIVARVANVPIIFRRIEHCFAQKGIQVYDINGNKLQHTEKIEKDFHQYGLISAENLMTKISAADIVTFDIFDTLLMRRVLYPRDIFHIVRQKLEKTCQKGGLFYTERVKAEIEFLGDGKHPNIYEIYGKIQGRLGLSQEEKKLWLDTELYTQMQYLAIRKEMVDILNYARKEKKDIFLVSDMYLPKEILQTWLMNFDIYFKINRLLISCDFGVSKCTGLFKVLREKVGNKYILHIGDDFEADIRAASNYNIDEAFHIKSSYDMLNASYANEVLQYDNTLENRIVIGNFISKALNNPFLFSNTKGKFYVKNNYDESFIFLAPMVYQFMAFLLEKIKELNLENILFVSRDGYILYQIYQKLKKINPNLPIARYFYTSRAVAVLSSLRTDNDILYAKELAYSGSLPKMLKSRFLLSEAEILPYDNIEDANAYILKHSAAILKNAAIARKHYEKYLSKINIDAGAKVGFVDFVSAGTCQLGISKIAPYDLYGIYFVRIYDEHKELLNIDALYPCNNVYVQSSYLAKDYFIMENVMTSFEASVKNFSSDGVPCFLEEIRTPEQLAALSEMHQALLDYGDVNIGAGIDIFHKTDKKLPDLLFHFLSEKYNCKLDSSLIFEKLADEFCNRKFTFG